MTKGNILIVEDDFVCSECIKINLENEAYHCAIATNGEDALELLQEQKWNLIVLDIMLPKMSGFEVCKLIKQDKNHKTVPIVMLTGRSESVDKILGFELGIDDYVVKPFDPRELVLRIKTILNRVSPSKPEVEVLNFENLTLDIKKHKVFLDNEEIQLTSLEFKLVIAFIENQGNVLTREYLLNHVWETNTTITTRTVDEHVKRLRKKLKATGELIETVRGFGYRLN